MFNMDILRFSCIFLFLIQTTLSKQIPLNDDVEEINFVESNEIFIKAEDGFQILISVENINITNQGEYILMKAGLEIDDGYDGIIFTGFLNTSREYLSLKNEIYITCKQGILTTPQRIVYDDEENVDFFADLFDEGETKNATCEEFKITVSRYGEGTTTTSTPTTPIPWPTPSYNESDSITVNLTGPSQYTESVLNRLRNNIAQMAIEYCAYNNIEGEISVENVLIDTIVQCPINWPKRKNCVQITFRLPIIRDNDDDYQLNSDHLEQMWLHYSKHLSPEFSIYNLPETSVFTLWLIIICVVILLFTVVLYLFKRFKQRLTGINKRKKSVNNSDQANMIPTQSPRNSLHPHPKQIVPGMFESETSYYDPDSTDNLR
nr:uncharacterized protein LOC111423932 [Onthophagus taurus]